MESRGFGVGEVWGVGCGVVMLKCDYRKSLRSWRSACRARRFLFVKDKIGRFEFQVSAHNKDIHLTV